MYKSKKAQAAMEFLMTYGWALLVVLIAIAALAFFGLLNPSRFLPEKCDVPAGLSCNGFAAKAGEIEAGYNLTFFLTNGMGETLYNFNVTVSNCQTNTAPAYLRLNGASVVQDLQLPEGETTQVLLACQAANSLITGDRFRGDITVNYTTRVENTYISHQKKGQVIVAVQ